MFRNTMYIPQKLWVSKYFSQFRQVAVCPDTGQYLHMSGEKLTTKRTDPSRTAIILESLAALVAVVTLIIVVLVIT